MTLLPQSVARARHAVGVIFLVNGTVFGSWAPHIPLVQERLGVGPAVLSTALLAMAVGALLAMPLAGALIARIGSASVTAVSGLLLCACLPLPVLAPSLPLLALALLLMGATNGAMDVAMNAHGVAVERHLGRPIMSSLHGMFSLGGLIGAGLGGLLFNWLTPAAHALLMAMVLLLVALAAMRHFLPGRADIGVAGPVFVLPGRATFGLGALGFLVLMSEGAVLDWSAAYLHRELAAGPSLAAAGFAAFSATMAAGRFGGDSLRHRLGAALLVRASAFLAALGLALGPVFGTAPAAVAGFALAGLGLANIVPVLFGTAGRMRGQEPGTAIAAVATMGYTGFLAGPPLIGYVAETTDLGTGLLVLVLASLIVGLYAGLTRAAEAGPSSRAAAASGARGTVP